MTFKKKGYSNADFLKRVERNLVNKLSREISKRPIAIKKQIKTFIPPDPRIQKSNHIINKQNYIAYRESLLNTDLRRFI